MKRNPRFAAGAQSRLPGFNESGSSKPGISISVRRRRVCGIVSDMGLDRRPEAKALAVNPGRRRPALSRSQNAH